MLEHKDKNQFIAEMQTGYADFEALLASLSEEQLTTPGVNGTWSIKDNLAHLNAWQQHVLDILAATPESTATEGLSEDEINEQIYQANKNRALAEVHAGFRSTYQRLLERVQAMSNAELNGPLPTQQDRNVWPFIAGNTYEHYREHAQIIYAWLAK